MGKDKKNKAQEQPSESLNTLVNDVKIKLCQDYLNENEGFALLQASPKLFVPTVKYMASQKNYPLRKLFSHAALGEWQAAKNIWQKDPSFFLRFRASVYHPNKIYSENQEPEEIPAYHNHGRYKYLNHSLFQIALRNEEYGVARQIMEHMPVSDIKEQFSEIFPDNNIACSHLNIETSTFLINKLWESFKVDADIRSNNVDNKTQYIEDLMSDETRKLLYRLYDYVQPNPDQQTGLVFDANIYYEAMKIHRENPNEINFAQISFWVTRVEEYLAYLLPSKHLQYHVVDKSKQNIKSENVLTDDSSYFSFRRSSSSLPGYNMFIGPRGQASNSCVRIIGGPHGIRININTFLRQIQSVIADRKMFQDNILNNYKMIKPGE